MKAEAKLQGMSITVISVANDSGSADAVRAVADKLSGDMVVVMSGDTVTDVPLDTVLFTHRMRGAVATTVLAESTSSAAATTKPGKIPKVCSVCTVLAVTPFLCIVVHGMQPQRVQLGVLPQPHRLHHWSCLQGVDYVALEPSTQRIISYAYDPDHLRRVVIPHSATRSCSPITLSTHYRDASIYILSRQFIAEIQNSDMSSIKVCLFLSPSHYPHRR